MYYTRLEAEMKDENKLWVFNQLDSLFSRFSSIYFSTSKCFKRQALIVRKEQLYQHILWYNLASVLYQRMC
jgi:hypothetical protein